MSACQGAYAAHEVMATHTSAPDALGTSSPLISPYVSKYLATDSSPSSRAEGRPSEGLWVDEKSLPEGLIRALRQAGYKITERQSPSAAKVQPLRSDSLDQVPVLAKWLFLLVAPFPTLADGTSWDELRAAWLGQRAWSDPAAPWQGRPLVMSPATYEAMRMVWGQPAFENDTVTLAPDEEVQEVAWAEQAWAVIPFEMLNPRWKVLRIDNHSGLEPDATGFPLWVSYGATGVEGGVEPVLINYNPEHLVTVILSGTTALVRMTALRMEENGVDYPGQVIAPLLRTADVLHISNEVSFDPQCPPAKPLRREARFCSDPRYWGLLEDIGTDVIELTGNHLLDWGEEPFLYTLDLYRQAHLPFYGGGANRTEAEAPLKVEIKGTRLAFLGCNAVGPETVLATEVRAGAAPCDLERMSEQIRVLRHEGYLPIVTFQHLEVEDFRPASQARYDFQATAQAGAVIVSGSQAHFPQGFAFKSGALIHYGLGNLFFDQMFYWNRRAFLDRHLFYEGRYLGVELITIILEDYAQPRLMTAAERTEMLQNVFAASDW